MVPVPPDTPYGRGCPYRRQMTPKMGVLPKGGFLAPQGYTKTVFFDYPLGSKHCRTLKKKGAIRLKPPKMVPNGPRPP